eukprot:3093670-Karenia_brevis.AAC.1
MVRRVADRPAALQMVRSVASHRAGFAYQGGAGLKRCEPSGGAADRWGVGLKRCEPSGRRGWSEASRTIRRYQ